MNDDNKTLELRVGIFVLVGLIAIAIMAVQFGRVGQGLTDYNQLKVIFPNASGLLKNSDVQLSGAVVGYVGSKPLIIPGKVGRVSVDIFIRENIKVPKGSVFQVGSTGMMGDKFVEIVIPSELEGVALNPNDPSLFYSNGETVEGIKQGGFNEVTQKAEVAMTKLAESLDAMKGAIGKLEQGLLSNDNLENIRDTFANLKTTGENFAEASKKISDVVEGAKDAVDTAKETMDSAKVTVGTVNEAAVDLRGAIADGRSAINTAQSILKKANTGDGTIPTLLNNPEVAANLKALISNLRRHGLLFYKDSAETPGAQPRSKPHERRSTRPPGRRMPPVAH